MKRFILLSVSIVLLSNLNYSQSVEIKDSADQLLLQVNDEGDGKSSITIPSSGPLGDPASKLYNEGGTLKWNGNPLATGGGSLWTLNTPNIYFDTGKVGIGTTNPVVNLDIYSPAVDVPARLRLTNSDGTHNLFLYSGHSGALPYISFKENDALLFTMFDGTTKELMRLSSSGNLGINTTNPAELLDVNGIAQMAGFKLPTGASTGHVLISDANGVGTWQENSCICDITRAEFDLLIARVAALEECVPETEICDGQDNDCDGVVDEGCGCTNGETRACGSNVGECVQGIETCSGGVWGACVGGVSPSSEICDGQDNDCDGVVDEECDFCNPNPCQQGGTCIDLGYGYACDCPDGWTGSHCQTNIDDCDPNPCLNGGICVDGVDGYTCYCEGTGHTGSNCETPE